MGQREQRRRRLLRKLLAGMRELHSLSIREAAEHLGISESGLWRYEQGDRAVPREMIPKIARLYDLDPDQVDLLFLLVGYVPNDIQRSLQGVEQLREVREFLKSTGFYIEKH